MKSILQVWVNNHMTTAAGVYIRWWQSKIKIFSLKFVSSRCYRRIMDHTIEKLEPSEGFFVLKWKFLELHIWFRNILQKYISNKNVTISNKRKEELQQNSNNHFRWDVKRMNITRTVILLFPIFEFHFVSCYIATV